MELFTAGFAMGLEELIQAANELNETELDGLLRQIVTLRAQRNAHGLPAESADLPGPVNQGAQWLDLLARLAQLRQVALPRLMETLGVQIRAELTLDEAAELLNVSYAYLIGKIEAGDMPHRREGADRWIDFEELMAYKQRIDAASSQALDEMVALSEDMGLYV
jgi:excisionase family DNA binding protein